MEARYGKGKGTTRMSLALLLVPFLLRAGGKSEVVVEFHPI
jgi:hypothetical protein